MSERALDPFRLDVQAFANDGGQLTGRWPLLRFERLVGAVSDEAPPTQEDEVNWSVRGETRTTRGAPPQTWLHLEAGMTLRLECQRCLKPVSTPVAIDRWFQFVLGEDAAAQTDIDSEEDVLALTRALDVSELVEDELLLALPLVPRHEVCAVPLPATDATDDGAQERVNPFAGLAALKRGGPLN